MTKTYTFTKPDPESSSGFTTIEATPERWCWGVVYNDGRELHQFGEDGIFHQFKEIEQDKVTLFCMFKLEDMTKRIDILVSPTMQIFHFYRNTVLNHGAGDERHIRTYCFGWKERDIARTIYDEEGNPRAEHLANHYFILPDDRIVITQDTAIDLMKFGI